MHAQRIIQELLDRKCPSIHAKRRRCLAKVSEAGGIGGLGVVKMGRSIKSKTSIRHRIKCCDRLLSNKHLEQDRLSIYRALAHSVLDGHQHIAVTIDWSELLADGSAHLLRAAVSVKGRAFVLYEEVHPQKDLASRAVHRHFLETLRTLLPHHCRPVLVTDAGFRATWFELANELSYSWIGRIRNRDMVCQQSDEQWAGCKNWYAGASTRPRCLGSFQYTRAKAISCQLVLYKKAPQGRRRCTVFGKKNRSAHSAKNRRAQIEPWLLAVSPDLKPLSPKQVVAIYASRMQIEQTFRDVKSANFGMGLVSSQTRKLFRLAVLLLLAALITYALWLVGLAAASAGYHVAYGSKRKASATVSTLNLARHYHDDPVRPALNQRHFKMALRTLINLVQVVPK